MPRMLNCLAGALLLAAPALWASPNLADYALRVRILQNTNHAHYRYRQIDWVDGDGRADLFEGGQPRGFDYGFRCGDRVHSTPGWETYPARWKKQDRELEILQPEMGKPGSWIACNLKVEMKDVVYLRHNGLIDEEPADKFKLWMERRQYDPEHGKNQPLPAPGPADETSETSPQ